ncbi:hypothetical protein H6P81_016093 [Aristolochia fimbriata]|uniref:Reverse transcriptase Ty1/copia-type domain-containing protein n=1 Tax=Aristolochia fimbriata TaxID=158543 RepID=A0AAV7EBY9_ARIFI|nr:hypothetical protein H6P81_016093 [Aristolochia fimbriata]
MNSTESISEYFERLKVLADQMEDNGETVDNQRLVEKALRSVNKKFQPKVSAIEEFKDLNKVTLNSLLGSLQAYEIRLKYDDEEETVQALQNCPELKKGQNGHYAKMDMFGESDSNSENALLLTCDVAVEEKNNMWFLDTGSSNHMTGQWDLFTSFDNTVTTKVKFVNNSQILVKGKGQIGIKAKDGSVQKISDVYYVPGLHSNLLSVGQLAEKGIFGSIVYSQVPKELRKKFDDKSVKCIFIGYHNQMKGYKLYNPVTRKTLASRDVIFKEEEEWSWTQEGYQEKVVFPFPNEPSTSETIVRLEVEEDVAPSLPISDEPFPSYSVPCSPSQTNISNFCLFADCDPQTYEEATKDDGWLEAMDKEIASIEKNDTWTLTTLPLEKKSIGVKWVYKTKYQSNGEIDKLKARLVVNGYRQKPGIDYFEVFAPVARLDTVQMILSLAAQVKWTTYQMDVQSAFLNGDSISIIQEFRKVMVRDFAMTDMGLMSYFLGLEVVQTQEEIFVSQQKYARDILKRFKMLDCNSVRTPMEERIKLDQGGKWRIDSDWAGEGGDWRSTSGYAFTLELGFFSWSSKKQQVVALSSIEAEYIAAAYCATQAVWLRQLLEEMYHKQDEPTPVIVWGATSRTPLIQSPTKNKRSPSRHE